VPPIRALVPRACEAGAIVRVIAEKAKTGDTAAWTALHDRLYGKPKETVETTVHDKRPQDMESGELDAAIARLLSSGQ
jgi:hypothetical protein